MLRAGPVSTEPPPDLAALVALLEGLADEPRRVAELSDELRRRLMVAAGKLSRPDRYMRKAMRKGLSRKIAGQTTDRVVGELACAVLVVKRPPEPDTLVAAVRNQA